MDKRPVFDCFRRTDIDWQTRPFKGVLMFRSFVLLLTIAMAGIAGTATSIYDFTLNSIDGTPTPIAHFKGKVVLLVNVARRCVYKQQYAGLE